LNPETGSLVGIVGSGLIGASVGLAARAAGFRTLGYDADPGHAARAAALGALDEIAASAEDAIVRADIVVIAVPVAPAAALLAGFPLSPRARLVTDVASVKVPVVAAARRVPSFVAGHPIAGSERSGPDAANADLFKRCAWALVPPADPDLMALAEGFVRALGACPFAIDAARHDALVAFTSHLPQVVATALGSALAERLDEPAVAELCGPGMRSMLRLASSRWSVWSSVLDANRDAVAQEVRAFAGILRSVADALDARDADALAARFADGSSAAARLATFEAPASVISDDAQTRGIV
jgi:prephenate dehydrogenase